MEIVTTSEPIRLFRPDNKENKRPAYKHETITEVTDLPTKPYLGMKFGTYGTNTIGTVEKINGSKITYSYKHDPEIKFIEPYNEVSKFAFLI